MVGKVLMHAFMCLYCVALGLFLDVVLATVASGFPLSSAFLAFSFGFFTFVFCLQFLLLRPDIYNVMPYVCLPIKRRLVVLLGVMSKTPSAVDLWSLSFFLSFFCKQAYLGALSVWEVAAYSAIAFFVSVSIACVVRFVKSVGSVVAQIMSLSLVLLVVYLVFRFVDFVMLVPLMRSAAFSLVMLVALPCLSYMIASAQFRREFYGVVEGAAAKGSLAMPWAAVGFSSSDRFVFSILVRNKTVMFAYSLMILIGSLNYNLGVLKGMELWYVPCFGITACGAMVFASHPFLYSVSYSFDGLYVSKPSLLPSLLESLFRQYALFNLPPALLCWALTGEPFLTLSLFLFAWGVIGFFAISSNRYASRRVDVFKAMGKGSGMDLRVFFLNALSLVAIGLSIVGYYWLQDDIGIYCAVLSAVGMALIVTHKIWIANTAESFMRRRHSNMSGFRGETTV